MFLHDVDSSLNVKFSFEEIKMLTENLKKMIIDVDTLKILEELHKQAMVITIDYEGSS